MFNKLVFFLSFLLALPVFSSAQDCDISFSGQVIDLSTGDAILYANIYITEAEKGSVSDSLGYFEFNSLCKGKYHVAITHIGCETQQLYINLTQDTILSVFLDHNSQLLNEVVVKAHSVKATTQASQELNSESIAHNSDKNLATMLGNISGVSVIKNGSGIAKPVVHGLYGNRLTILNNGVAQSGQQWGVDHSPEIDPLVANKITVVKGVGALEYQGSSLGSVVLVEPKKIDKEPHLHGEILYSFESNGRGHGVNLKLQQYGELFAWRMVGTLKKSGDNKTSEYYLRNTGSEEANIAIQMEKAWNSKWSSDFYFSSFNTNIGVLRGSHISSTKNLMEAIRRDVPFYTEPDFSYDISAPAQRVNHQLVKIHTKYNINDRQWLDLNYAVQYNLRKEFDIRRGGRTDMPALSLAQFSNFIEGNYKHYFETDWVLKSGAQINIVDNTNIPETDILPLIPDYIAFETGVFASLTKRIKGTTIEFGGRYDFENRKVVAISNSVDKEILRYENNYNNLSILGGLTQIFLENWTASYNIGFSSRNPEINELYSNGLHQGVSGIEEGDPTLTKELSLKNTFSIKGNIASKLSLEGLFYHQYIKDYIYLQPQDEIRLTIQGAFPIFKYEQTDARLLGFDLAGTLQATDRFNITTKYSYLDGYDRINDLPLIYMPSNNLYALLNYQIPELWNFQNVELAINGKYVFEQKNILDSQDFLSPPKAYYLLGLKIATEKQLGKVNIKMHLKAENILNETYRDYLNRQRYFADDLGTNIIAGINIGF